MKKKQMINKRMMHDGKPGVVRTEVFFMSREELMESPVRSAQSQPNNQHGPVSIAEIAKQAKSRSITYTDHYSQEPFTINFDDIDESEWDRTYLVIQSNFYVGGQEDMPEPKLIFKDSTP
jgi:hypothetical protein